jgi:hypothetical protein
MQTQRQWIRHRRRPGIYTLVYFPCRADGQPGGHSVRDIELDVWGRALMAWLELLKPDDLGSTAESLTKSKAGRPTDARGPGEPS